MIVRVNRNKNFGWLARYLCYGEGDSRVKDSEMRVAFSETRNLFEETRLKIVREMQVFAMRSERVEYPIAHLIISWKSETDDSPGADNPTKKEMIYTADQVLNDLGLGEHQAWIIGHKNTRTPHVHIMANRVHPYEGIAWDMWQAVPRAVRTLRRIEKEKGWFSAPHAEELATNGFVRRDRAVS